MANLKFQMKVFPNKKFTTQDWQHFKRNLQKFTFSQQNIDFEGFQHLNNNSDKGLPHLI
jgi:protein associated with RNAse G/E